MDQHSVGESVHKSNMMDKDMSEEVVLEVTAVEKALNIPADIEEKQSPYIVHHAMMDIGAELLPPDIAQQEAKNVQLAEKIVQYYVDAMGNTIIIKQEIRQDHCCPRCLVNCADRCCGILEVPAALIFGILLYLVDVGSDIVAGVTYFREGHRTWGFLTIGFVLFSSISCAAFSWTYWYYDRERDPAYRRKRMILAVLIMEPLVRQARLLGLTFRREWHKFKECCCNCCGKKEREPGERDSKYWQRRVDAEERTAAFPTAIATLVEDTAQITLALYIIACHGEREDFVGYVQLITSLISVFYTTAQFPQQVRLLDQEETHIKFFSKATAALLVSRTLIISSRIIAFLMFACLFNYWLFFIIGFHCLLMFALVSYQMYLAEKKLLQRVLYSIVTPFVYIFDFCVNWLHGPTRYWYVICYVPMFCENALMCAMVFLQVSYGKRLARRIMGYRLVLGCLCVMVMFPVGVLIQLAYYRYWHPKIKLDKVQVRAEGITSSHPTQLQCLSWSAFRDKVIEQNQLIRM